MSGLLASVKLEGVDGTFKPFAIPYQPLREDGQSFGNVYTSQSACVRVATNFDFLLHSELGVRCIETGEANFVALVGR